MWNHSNLHSKKYKLDIRIIILSLQTAENIKLEMTSRCKRKKYRHRRMTYREVSVTWLGDFLKVLGDKVSSKVAILYVWLFGLKWKMSLLGKNCCSYFLGNFLKHLRNLLFRHLVSLRRELSCHSQVDEGDLRKLTLRKLFEVKWTRSNDRATDCNI